MDQQVRVTDGVPPVVLPLAEPVWYGRADGRDQLRVRQTSPLQFIGVMRATVV